MEQVKQASAIEYGIIEVLDRGGRVVQRREVDHNPVTFGRAYDNDIILDDPYVCPEHVSVFIQGDKLIVEDLDSMNGIYQNKYHFKGEKLSLSSNDTFRIGHTTIRYRAANAPLHTTKKDRHVHSSFWSIQNPVLVSLGLIVLTSFIFVETIFSQTEETDNLKILAESIPVLLTVAGWAGLWALFGKLMIDKMSFFTHLGIFTFANIGFYVSSITLSYVFFAFGFDGGYTTAVIVSIVAIVTWMIYTHLGYSTKMSPRSMLTVSVTLSLIGTAIYLLQSEVAESEFNYAPSYDVILKSPDMSLVTGDSLDDFFARTEKLKMSLTASIKDD